MNNSNIDNYDLATVLSNNVVHSGQCSKQYNVVINAFAKFLKVYGIRELNVSDFSDEKIALFLHHTGTTKGFKPHIKKSTQAVLNDKLKSFGLANLCEAKSMWPACTQLLMVCLDCI